MGSSSLARRRKARGPGRRPAQPRPKRPAGRQRPAPGPSHADGVDFAAFAIFAAYVVLAFTTSFPEQFALPKLLGLFVYVAFAAARWTVALRRGRVRTLPRILALTVLTLSCWWILTTVTAQHVTTAVFGMRGRYNGLATMLAELALFLILATTRLSDQEVERRLGAICIALVAASGYALLQSAGIDPFRFPESRPASTLGHPVVLAWVLAMVLPFGLLFGLWAQSRAGQLAWGALTTSLGLALVLTLARGPWIAALCGFVLVALLGVVGRPAVARRLAALVGGAVLAVALLLAMSTSVRTAVLSRVATGMSLSEDSSVRYRIHFCRAALAMVRDHPLVGVGWENFGLLYPAYRSSPTGAIAPDLVPTMVHSGPIQTAVSGGIPALTLELIFFAVVGVLVARRRRAEPEGRQRLLGAVFLASGTAYLIGNVTGWPHVAMGTLAFVVFGLAVSWGLVRQPQFPPVRRWVLVPVAVAVAIGSCWLSHDTWRRIRAETSMFEAEQLAGRGLWEPVEARLREVLALSPDQAWANHESGKLYLKRLRSAGGRRTYERGVQLAAAAHAANPLDPYIRLQRARLDIAAIDHGLIPGLTDGGREALADAKSMARESRVVRGVEISLFRRVGVRIVWIEPSDTAGFGSPGSLIVAGSSASNLIGTHVVLHWRNSTRGSDWATGDPVSVIDGQGNWYAVIPDAQSRDKYEVYAASEAASWGPCTYSGSRSISLCSTLAFFGPDTSGVGPPGSLMVAGSIPEAWPATDIFLNWRNATRRTAWQTRSFHPGGIPNGVSFPADARGNWYCIIPDAVPGDQYEAYLSSSKTVYEPCAYSGDRVRKLCSPIAWIEPQGAAGFGPIGSLVIGGAMSEGFPRAPIFLHVRNVTRHSEWTSLPYAPVPDERGTWYNYIPDANFSDRYQLTITSPIAASESCSYDGDGMRNVCQLENPRLEVSRPF